MKSRINPITIAEAPIIAKIFPKVPCIAVTILSQFNAAAVPNDTAPAAIKAIPRGSATPVKARMAPTARSAPPTIPLKSFRTGSILFFIASQSIGSETTIPTAPAAIIAIPRGILTPVKARIAPIPNKAPLTIVVIVLIVSSKSPFIDSQLRATAEARETAPAAMRPIPRGMLAPVKARIAPNASNPPPTIDSNVVIVVRIGSDKLSQFRATAVARPTAPAAIKAIPRGISTPVKANNAPIANNPPLTIPVRIDNVLSKSPSRNFQFIVAAVARDTAPNTIRAAPRPTFTPVNARKAPIARENPPMTLVTVVSTSASLSDIVSQFAAIEWTRLTAPTAIKPNPRGIFAPVTSKIVPIANKKPPTIASISERESVIILVISSTLVSIASPIKS